MVQRDEEWRNIPARELVPGDLIRMCIGDVFPADVMLLRPDGNSMEIDQAAITGEAHPKTKFAGDEAFNGTVVKRGEMEAVVLRTGKDTEHGKAAAMVAKVRHVGNFQKILMRITLSILIVSLVLIGIIFAKLLSVKVPILEALSVCVCMLVASIPIAMQVVSTSVMAVGAHQLAKKNAIVSRLASIEELAGMDVLCSDKTGTLTKNQLTIQQDDWYPKTTPIADIIRDAVLASKKNLLTLDAIDRCIWSKAKEMSEESLGLSDYFEEKFIPFDPTIKRTESILR